MAPKDAKWNKNPAQIKTVTLQICLQIKNAGVKKCAEIKTDAVEIWEAVDTLAFLNTYAVKIAEENKLAGEIIDTLHLIAQQFLTETE